MFQCKIAQQECKEVIDKNVDISLELKAAEKKCHEITKSWQDAQALLVDATSEVQVNYFKMLQLLKTL